MPHNEPRDTNAVLQALREIDPCELLDVDQARDEASEDAATLPIGAHACSLSLEGDHEGGNETIESYVGTYYAFQRRYADTRIELAGIKAYWDEKDGGCTVHMPVSFTKAIGIEYRPIGDFDACEHLEPYATSAAERIQKPEKLELDSQRLLSAWDGCSLLLEAMDGDEQDYHSQPHGPDPFSGCNTSLKDRGESSKSEDYSSVTFDTSYTSWPPNDGENKREIAGHDVYGKSSENGCEASWSLDATATDNERYSDLVANLSGESCDKVEGLVEKIDSLADQGPSDTEAEPQRPVYYEPDEPDTRSKGACADFGPGLDQQRGCAPYAETEVPDGAKSVLRGAAKDPNVLCAVFDDAMGEAYDVDYSPVTWNQQCFFVEPSHSLQIRTVVGTGQGTAPEQFGHDAGFVDREVKDVGGNEAVVFWNEDETVYNVFVSPYDDVSRPGTLQIQAEMNPANVTGRDDDSTDVPSSTIEKIEDVMSRVVAEHFD